MSTSESIVMVVLTLALGFAGWNCVVKNAYLVKIHRQQADQAAGTRFYPFARLIKKNWYPQFVRGCGIAIWLCALVVIYFSWFREPAH